MAARSIKPGVCWTRSRFPVRLRAVFSGRPPGRRPARWTRVAGPEVPADAGMSTAEYAIGTVAACGFAALLFKIVTSDQVRRLLTGIITKALNLAG